VTAQELTPTDYEDRLPPRKVDVVIQLVVDAKSEPQRLTCMAES
jgi:hypothetical protein